MQNACNATLTTSANPFRRCVLSGLAIVVLFLAAVYHRGEDSCILIPDCLDSSVALLAGIAQSDVFLGPSDAPYAPLMNGIPRGCLPSETGLFVWPYRYLSPLSAYIFSEAVVRIAALLGMALLLKRHVLPAAPDYLITGVAVCFALLPFHPCVGLSVAGQPLLLYALWNLRKRDLWFGNWLMVALFPFCSAFALVGFAILALLAAYLAFQGWMRRRMNGALAAAGLLLAAGYLIAEYRLVLQVWSPSAWVSHRAEFVLKSEPLRQALKMALGNLIRNEYHAPSMQYPLILAICGLVLAIGGWHVRRAGSWDAWQQQGHERDGLLAALAACAAISLGYGLFYWSGVRHALGATGSTLLREFPFQRIHWLHPLLWTLALACALTLLLRLKRWGKLLVVGLIGLQLAIVLRADYYAQFAQPLTYRQFFSPLLFAEIKAFIGKSPEDYRVVSLGMHPAIAQYNGFYVLDGYQVLYPLEYKHRFRAVIAPELDRDAGLRRDFDQWGSRCYLFCSEVKECLSTKHYRKRKVQHLLIDTEALRRLGGRYILSAVEIENHHELGLTLARVFQRDDSPWQIFLYAVALKPEAQAKDR
jgi:hypothetical protein